MGTDAIVLACHVSLILSLLFMGLNLEALIAGRSGRFYGAIFLASIAVERTFYANARVLKFEGIDLWSAHPAPEILSALVAVSAFTAVAVPLWGFSQRDRGVVVAVGAGIVFVWGVMVAALS